MSIACHAGESGSIPLVGAYHSVLLCCFTCQKKILNLTAGYGVFSKHFPAAGHLDTNYFFFGRKLLVP